jgi:hypothetical protein
MFFPLWDEYLETVYYIMNFCFEVEFGENLSSFLFHIKKNASFRSFSPQI